MVTDFEIKVPSLGESITQATVARWIKNPGDLVRRDEILLELETDKVTVEVHAPSQGVLKSILHPQGSTVSIGDVLGVLGESPLSLQDQGLMEKISIPVDPSSLPLVSPFSPAVRRLITDHQLDPSTLSGTGKDQRLTKSDVIMHLTQEPPSSPPSKDQEREKRVPLSQLRQRIAQRLKDAQNTAAILTTFNEVDMSAIYKLRQNYQEKFQKKYGARLGFMSFFVKSTIQALKEIPAMNAEIDHQDIVYKNYYDIGVAVSAPQGLVVPILRGADRLSFDEIEKNIADLGVKAREGKLGLEEMTGGTFTISNGGIFGSLLSTPILNPPQTGILGMHKIQDRPVVVEGVIEIKPMMYVALSYDHRLIDGREAVQFLVRIKENIENPERLLFNL